MVPLAGSSIDGDHPVLICSVHTDCVPLREMLSLLLSRRHIEHRAFLELDDLLAFLASSPAPSPARAGARAGVRTVVMVGPRLRADQVSRIDHTLVSLAGTVDLVVFHDALDDQPVAWEHAQTTPSLRSPIPPRLTDVLRVVEGRPP